MTTRYRVRMDFCFEDGAGNSVRIPWDNMRHYDDGTYQHLFASIREEEK